MTKWLLAVSLLLCLPVLEGCNTHHKPETDTNFSVLMASHSPLAETPEEASLVVSGLQHVIFGSSFFMCRNNCARLYKQTFTGNRSTVWAGYGDNFTEREGWKFDYQFRWEANELAYEFTSNIPDSIFRTQTTFNKIGYPGSCQGEGQLYFEFLTDEPGAKPISFFLHQNMFSASSAEKTLADRVSDIISDLSKIQFPYQEYPGLPQ